MVREQHGLRTLQMCIAGHDGAQFAAGDRDKGLLKLSQPRDETSERVPQVKPQIERDLIVAATPRVQLAPHLSDDLGQPQFDGHMDVFLSGSESKAPVRDLALDLLEPFCQPGGLPKCQQSRTLEREAMGQTPRDVMEIE